MIFIQGERSILVRLFAGQLTVGRNGQNIEELGQLPPAEVSAVYFDDDPNQFVPDLLIVDTPHLREFFAWCSTYLPQWSPLTAGMSVVERSNLDSSFNPKPRRLPRQLIRGLLCVALGELLFEWKFTSGQALPSILSLRSTFGYVATCAAITDRTCLNDLLSKWFRAQHLLQLNPRQLNARTLKSVWAPLSTIVRPTLEVDHPHKVIAELAELIAGDSRTTLLRHRPLPFATLQRREQIVVELETYIRDTKLIDSTECFETAVIAARMSTNPVGHFDVLSEMTAAEPRTLLWYSFLTGMFSSDPAASVFENILYRVESDLRDSPSPKPDISLEELEVLVGPHSKTPDGIGIGAQFINVELDFGVCASFRLPRHVSEAGTTATQMNDSQLFEDLLEQLRVIFERNSSTNKGARKHSQVSKSRRRRSR